MQENRKIHARLAEMSGKVYCFFIHKRLKYIQKNSEIADQDYNLSVSTYVEQEDTREKIDIKVLNKEIAEIVAREQVLRDGIDKIIAEIKGGGDFE